MADRLSRERRSWNMSHMWECEIEHNFEKTMDSVLQDLSRQLSNQPG